MPKTTAARRPLLAVAAGLLAAAPASLPDGGPAPAPDPAPAPAAEAVDGAGAGHGAADASSIDPFVEPGARVAQAAGGGAGEAAHGAQASPPMATLTVPSPSVAALMAPPLTAATPTAASGRAALGQGEETGPAPATAQPWQGPADSVGKLVWVDGDGATGACSAAAVDAPNGSVVATAAHCLAGPDQGGEPVSDAWFLPGHRPSSAGAEEAREAGWEAREVHLPDAWQPDRDLHASLPHDYAFFTVAPKGGRTLQQAHGAHRLAFAPVTDEVPVRVLGYPATDPYDGDSPHHCGGPTRVLREDEAAPANVGGLLLRECELTRGASGGPWLQDVDPDTGKGTLVAVTSVGDGAGGIVGRPYPQEAMSLFETAGASTVAGAGHGE